MQRERLLLVLTCILSWCASWFTHAQMGDSLIRTEPVFEGTTVRLECESNTKRINEIYQWILNDTHFISQSNRELVLPNVKVAQSGRYKCLVNWQNEMGEMVTASKAVELIIKQANQIREIQVEEGKTVRLDCMPKGPDGAETRHRLAYIWYSPLGREPVSTDRFIMYNVTKGKSGTYTCEASYEDQTGQRYTASQSIILTVIPGEETELILPDAIGPSVEITETGDIYQRCHFKDDPSGNKYSYVWYNARREMVSNSSVLNLNYILKSASGNYQCVGTHTNGNQRQAELELVVVPLRFHIITIDENRRIPGHSRKKIRISTLPWPVTSTRESFEYTWLKPDNSALNDFNSDEINIPINSVQDFGLYHVQVKGQNSGFNYSLRFQILPSPENKLPNLILEQFPQDPIIGQTAQFACKLDDSKLHYTVSYILPNNQRINNQTLVFQPLTMENLGNYTCSILVPELSTQLKQHFVIEAKQLPPLPPKPTPSYTVSIFMKPDRYRFDDRVVLRCQVNPPSKDVQYTWIKDGQVVTRGPVYVIERFTADSIGYLRCQAEVDGYSASSDKEMIMPPGTITIQPKPVTVRAREPFSFQCISSGSFPEVVFGDGRMVSMDPRFQITASNGRVLVNVTHGLSENEEAISIYCVTRNPEMRVRVPIIIEKSCPLGQYRCGSGECLPESLFCNQQTECRDGSDEMDYFCQKPPEVIVVPPRNPFKFNCVVPVGSKASVIDGKTGYRLEEDRRFIIERISENNVTVQAMNGLTELESGFMIRCVVDGDSKSSHSIIINIQVICPSGKCQCKSETCLPMAKFCDGNIDCPDGSDEDAIFCQHWRRDRYINFIRSDPYRIMVRPREPIKFSCTSDRSNVSVSARIFSTNQPLSSEADFSITYPEPGRIEVKAPIGIVRNTNPRTINIECYATNDRDTYPSITQIVLIPSSFCGAYERVCNDERTCIDEKFWCDGRPDCPDGSDESRQSCPDKIVGRKITIHPKHEDIREYEYFTLTCSIVYPGGVSMTNEPPPIFRWARNGTEIFSDNSTGIKVANMPSGRTLTFQNGLQSDFSPIMIECVDQLGEELRDEVTIRIKPNMKCQQGQRQCQNGECVSAFKWCDNVIDCSDSSDEDNCVPLPSYEYKYRVRIMAKDRNGSIFKSVNQPFQIECLLLQNDEEFFQSNMRLEGQFLKLMFRSTKSDLADHAGFRISYEKPPYGEKGQHKIIARADNGLPFTVSDIVVCDFLDRSGERDVANLTITQGFLPTERVFWQPSSTRIEQGTSFTIVCIVEGGSGQPPTVLDRNGQDVQYKPGVRLTSRSISQNRVEMKVLVSGLDKNETFICKGSQGETARLDIAVKDRTPMPPPYVEYQVKWIGRIPTTLRYKEPFSLTCEIDPMHPTEQPTIFMEGRPINTNEGSFRIQRASRGRVTLNAPQGLDESVQFTCQAGSLPPIDLFVNVELPPMPPMPPRPRCDLASEFACADRQTCINRELVCDDNADCPDGSDEANCLRCSSTEFRCRDRSRCIPYDALCNQKRDCNDNSDESDCSRPPPRPHPVTDCNPDVHYCPSSNATIGLPALCDAEKDCPDNSDEGGCAKYERIPGMRQCGGTHFICASGLAVPFWYQCDNNDDCGDSSDEQFCSKAQIFSLNPAKEMVARIGDTVVLECEAVGKPVPIITWRFNWLCLPDMNRMTSKMFKSRTSPDCTRIRSELTIRNVQPADGGLFNCQAQQISHRALSEEIKLTVI